MITSKDIFAQRKVNLDDAYLMALQLVNQPEPDSWDFKAFAWCLIDLIKRDTAEQNRQYVPHYQQQLELLPEDPWDDVLTKQRKYALSLCNPHSDILRQAKSLSQAGQHHQAAELYRNVLRQGENSVEVRTSLAWELYRLTKEITSATTLNLNMAKRYLNEYLQLSVEKPSLLHSCILQQADKLAKEENFNIATFARLWGLECFRREDFDRQTGNDGKVYPALAEKVIQQASKLAVKTHNRIELEYLLPHLDNAISHYPDNIWLKFYKAKLLLALDKTNDALAFGISVVKAKTGDFWAWELLGDICLPNDKDAAFGCYCKALCCSSDINFTAKVKAKLAHLLIEQGNFAAAKYEVQKVIDFKQQAGHKIPIEFESITQQPWYRETTLPESNHSLYKEHGKQAEQLLHSQLPWIFGNLGEKYTVPSKEGKTRRKLFVQQDSASIPLEVSFPESKFALGHLHLGDALQIKGELDHNKVFQVYAVERRCDGTAWDVLTEVIGLVDHINHTKKLVHYIVNKNCDGVIPFADLNEKFSEGQAIALKLSKYSSKQGMRYRVVESSKTDKKADSSVSRSFSEYVEVNNDMGFTTNDIFIAPPLIKKYHIWDGAYVTGVAVISYNKKRASWGWKAMIINDIK